MNDDEVSALDDRIELAVRRAIAQELTSHRDYIGQLSKFTAIAAFTVLAFLATALTFWFGNRLDELQETMLPDATKQMEQSVADINENLLSRANKLVSDTVDELNISAIVAREFDTQTQSEIVRRLTEDETLVSALGQDMSGRIQALRAEAAISQFRWLMTRWEFSRCSENPTQAHCPQMQPPIVYAYAAAAARIMEAEDPPADRYASWCRIMAVYTESMNFGNAIWPILTGSPNPNFDWILAPADLFAPSDMVDLLRRECGESTFPQLRFD